MERLSAALSRGLNADVMTEDTQPVRGARRGGALPAVLVDHITRYQIYPSPMFELFLSLAARSRPDVVEPVVTVNNGRAFHQRATLYYYDRKWFPHIYDHITLLYRAVERSMKIQLDERALIDLVSLGLRFRACLSIAVGMDLRARSRDLRLTLAFLLRDGDTSLVSKLYRLTGVDGVTARLLTTWTQLVAVAFHRDGSSQIALYPEVPCTDYSALISMLGLDCRVVDFIHLAPSCTWCALDPASPLHVLVTGAEIARVIDDPLVATLDPTTRYALSALPLEISAQNIRNFHICYANDRLAGTLTHVYPPN